MVMGMEDEYEVGPWIPIGIDIGSMYVRVAYGPPAYNDGATAVTAEQIQLVTNEWGQRSTLSVVAMEEEESLRPDDTTGSSSHMIFGEAAYKHLMRQHPKVNIWKQFNLHHLLSSTTNEEETQNKEELIQGFLVHLLTCTLNAIPCRATQLRMVVSTSDGGMETQWQRICEMAWKECCQQECPILKNKKKKKQWMEQYVEPIQPILAMCNPASASLCHLIEQTSQPKDTRTPSSIAILDWGASGLHKTVVDCTTTNNYDSYDGLLYRNPLLTSNVELSGLELQQVMMKQIVSIFCRQSRIPEIELLENKKKMLKLQTYMPEALRTLARGNTARIDIDEFYEGYDLHIQLPPIRWEMMLQSSSYWKQVQKILSSVSSEKVILIGNVWQMPMAQKCISHLPIVHHNNKKNPAYEEIVVKGCALFAHQLSQYQQDQQSNQHAVIPIMESIPTSPVTIGIRSLHTDQCQTLIETNVTPLPATISYRHDTSTTTTNETDGQQSPSSILQLVQIVPSDETKVLAEFHPESSSNDELVMDMEVYLSKEGTLQVSANGGPRMTIG